MHKILLIIQREYFTRIQKKSFWIASILTPLLITAIYAIPIWLATQDKDIKRVEFLDQSGLFDQQSLQHKEVQFELKKGKEESFKSTFLTSDYEALVIVPANILEQPNALKIYTSKSISIGLQSDIERIVQDRLRKELLAKAGIQKEEFLKTQVEVSSRTMIISQEGGEKSSNAGGIMILAGILGFILYMTVLIYGSQVMNGVIEEKSNRIIEVMVSSVKPIQLMLGKILGVGLVGLTQFLLWGVLTFSFTNVAKSIYGKDFDKKIEQQVKQQVPKAETTTTQKDAQDQDFNPFKVLNEVQNSVNIPLLLSCFLFFFFFGYLLYSSLFAAIGSAAESAAEAQQFTLPVTIPIIISFFLAQFTIQDPDSTIAFWASIIPFTSPINMMVRIPYGVPVGELVLSMVLLVACFLAISWLSARIYRVGILMYGKKLTWKELGKWLFYTN